MSRALGRGIGVWLLLAIALAAATGTAAEGIGGDFTLTADDGRAFTLHESSGKVVLLAFGYTHCPDVCPTTLARLRQVLHQLEQDADRIQVLFVTLDPLRDTAAHLQAYVRFFDRRFIGLTGSPSEVDKVARQYGVRYAIRRDASAAAAYTLDHGADLYLLDRRGEASAILPFGTPTDRIVELVRGLLPGEPAPPGNMNPAALPR